MKKAVVFIVVIALLSNCAYSLHYYRDYKKTRPIVISPQVGETIDLEEREQFDLFHGIEDFKAATFYGIEGGGYEVEIVTANEQLIVVNRDPQAVEILQDYIERYEEIKDSREAFEEKWQVVDYDDFGLPITHVEVKKVDQGIGRIGYGIGCGFVGIIPAGIMAFLAGGGNITQNIQDKTTAYIVFIVVMAANIAAGVGIGSNADRNYALKVIKEARKPKVVE
jgi:hypothetical protein